MTPGVVQKIFRAGINNDRFSLWASILEIALIKNDRLPSVNWLKASNSHETNISLWNFEKLYLKCSIQLNHHAVNNSQKLLHSLSKLIVQEIDSMSILYLEIFLVVLEIGLLYTEYQSLTSHIKFLRNPTILRITKKIFCFFVYKTTIHFSR